MRILQLHCSEFGYEVKKETPVAEQPPNPRRENLENVLVCFICFEKKDESRIKEISKTLVENLKIDASRVGCNTVLLYPYAHLSKSLGSARLAKTFLSRLRDLLSKEGIETHKSPFGWYKAFNLNCIGHPLAEAYREF
jgi:threonyl-tRNA synthetase